MLKKKIPSEDNYAMNAIATSGSDNIHIND